MSAELQLILEKINGLGSDIRELKVDMQELRTELKSDMHNMQIVLESKMDHVIIEMRSQFKYTEKRLQEHTQILQIISNRLSVK